MVLDAAQGVPRAQGQGIYQPRSVQVPQVLLPDLLPARFARMQQARMRKQDLRHQVLHRLREARIYVVRKSGKVEVQKIASAAVRPKKVSLKILSRPQKG